ncbi:hypothetical protein TRIUR3_01046 [Triticum urartu]|uniref:DUF1764 domain-containing protein n=2 Tax=Triticum urartu TaxID=4572 RepID=M7Z088_TRIUA|nr:hypothetical protein TRIUR3_01046 [Triticum urartu]
MLHNRLVASVNNAGFLAHLEKVRDEPLHQHTKLSIGGVTEVDIGDIPYTKDEGKTGSWLLVSCDTAGGNLEEISGIDDENYVMVNEDDIVDAIATFVARCILEDPKSKSLSSKELQKAVATALSSMTDRKKWISFWEAGKVIYILATWGITIAGLYRSRAVLKMAAKGAVVSTKFIMKAFARRALLRRCVNDAKPEVLLDPPSSSPGLLYPLAVCANPSPRAAATPRTSSAPAFNLLLCGGRGIESPTPHPPMATKSQKKKKLSAPNPSIDAKKPKPQKPVEERETAVAGAAKKPKPKKQKEVSAKKPKEQKVGKEVSAKKTKKQKESNEIDEIFEATKKRKLQEEEEEESEGDKKPKKGKAEGAGKKKSKKETGGKGWEPGHDDEVEEKRPRRRTNDGLTIYSADELGFGKADAGGTALCPFDCDCCF